MTWAHLGKATATTVAICAPTIVEALLGRLTSEVCDERLNRWSRRLIEQAGIRLEVRGREHAQSAESFVVMSNHQSLYDIPVIFQALPRRVRMVAKRELFRVPVWGRAMALAGFVPVDRDNHDSALKSMQLAAAALRRGTDIWIAPEGTRSRDGKLGAFRKGGFHLALGSGARILPVTLLGTRAVLPAKGRRVQPGMKVVVHVHEPVSSQAYGEPELPLLMAQVRAAIAAPLADTPAEGVTSS